MKVDEITEPGSLPAEAGAGRAHPAEGRGGDRGEPAHDARVPAGPPGDVRAVLPRRRERRDAGVRRPGLVPDPGRRDRSRSLRACASTRRWRTYGPSEDRPRRFRNRRGELLPPADRQRRGVRPAAGRHGGGALGRRSGRGPRPEGPAGHPGGQGLAGDPRRSRRADRRRAGRRRGQPAATHPRGAVAEEARDHREQGAAFRPRERAVRPRRRRTASS